VSRALVLSLGVVLVGAPAFADAPLEAAASVATAVTQKSEPFEIEEKGRLTISVAHAFALSEAVDRLGYLLAYWKKRFNIESEWHGNRVFLSGAVYGVKVQAMFEISENAVVGFARDPGWPWRGQVSGYVDRKLKKYLSPTYDDP
jgi:hypothetical protein